MVQIVTPLAQVLSPQRQTSFSPSAPTQLGEFQTTGLQNQQRQQQIDQEKQLQRAANVNQAAITGLNIIKRDPVNAETNLRDFIAQRKIVNPSLGITDTTDTDELERVLNEGGVPAAQQLFQSSLDAVRSSGVPLPQPTTPDFEQTFTAVGASGKPEIFFRSDQGPIPTGLLAPPKTPLVNITPGGGDKERTRRFGELFDEKKNIDKTLRQFNQVRDIVAEGGLGAIGTSGKVTRGLEKAASAIGGFVRNLGIVDDFDQDSIVSGVLKGTPLGEQANRNAKVNSLITNIAFAVAQAQNPGGRITDKDFTIAVQTIGANADNPEQLTGVINQFGNNLLAQFEDDVRETGKSFGFSKQQTRNLLNIPSRKQFAGGLKAPQITATTKPSDLTPEQAQQLARDNPELLRAIIANAKRVQ